MTLRRVTWLLLAVAQASTGVYLLVYLYRWQWNRALITGVLFIATEVLLLGYLILQRVRSLEERLTAPSEVTRRALVDTRPDAPDRFAWLREASTTGTNVFLPVLLSAGVVASALAWLVETVARRTARPTAERSLAVALTPFTFPAHGFLRDAPRLQPRVPLSLLGRAGLVVAALAVVVGIGASVDVVADATQSRPDRLERGATTIVDLQLRGQRAAARPESQAADLLAACRSRFRRALPTAAVLGQSEGRVRVVVAADIGRNGREQLRGCLEDTTLERVQADVVEIHKIPPPRR